jgi:hypothetical protein
MTAQAMLNLNDLRVEFLQSGQSEILRAVYPESNEKDPSLRSG